MKNLMLISFALTLVMSLLALAQEATKPGEMKQETTKAEKASAKAVSLSGKVSANGKRFVDKDNKSWTVTNPEALKGHEGHEVTLKAHEDAAKKWHAEEVLAKERPALIYGNCTHRVA